MELHLLLLGMSPCCKTFTRIDSMNMDKGTNYRLHGPLHPDRPPKDRYSTKGREAHAADRMVKQEQSV